MADVGTHLVIDADLDSEIERLIGKIVSRQASPEEQARFHYLSQQRVQAMQPRFVERHKTRHRLRA